MKKYSIRIAVAFLTFSLGALATSALVLMLLLVVPAPCTSQTTRREQVIDKDEDVTQPVISNKPEPEQPSDYRGPRIELVIVLKAIFRSSGEVTDIKLSKVTPKGTPKKLAKDLVVT